jgi:hypothetical protein
MPRTKKAPKPVKQNTLVLSDRELAVLREALCRYQNVLCDDRSAGGDVPLSAILAVGDLREKVGL